ncbi:ATPase [Fervidicoccus fontis]|jgi:flagellar protein FlaH|uniref:Archaeal flagellar protein FlaH n=2 Tax=Fervidicoccus fontis TaxID=683846 RepID=I0A1Q9_FERFK|nr:ATPase domain-containing protein [Fervidicoccus fontis]AFH42916.1 archaeal flagellar protein FlaH [Fervidicoccus fontis Kam940]MBE9391526.1 ATPase [Fervidicoccus fontis]PMB77197.1 MAG: KaiC domain-containing protein [Fervidicoccus fontis]HEW63592.1 ATPase [Fervidicoccus fontis]
MKTTVSTGNDELDVRLQGGLPYPSLILIEGEQGTSKTVLAQQFVYGALRDGLRGIVLETEMPSVDFLRKMKLLKMDIVDYVIKGKVRLHSILSKNLEINDVVLSNALTVFEKYINSKLDNFDFLAIDSLSMLVKFAKYSEVLEFFSNLKKISTSGKLIFATMHSSILSEDILTKLRAFCDGYIKLGISNIGGRSVKVMNIVKLRGAPTSFDSVISFDVDPAFGIKLVPIALARA